MTEPAANRDYRAVTLRSWHPERAAWLAFVAARFPEYERTAGLAWWAAYALENGLDDICEDKGHEFWCRFGEGTCRRKGALTCNDDQAWMAGV